MNRCKSNLFLFLLFFFSMSSAFATDFAVRTLIDKTHVRDNTYCKLQGKTLELEIRSFDQYSSSADAAYGEHFFMVQDGNYELLPLNKNLMGRYRFLKGKDENCSKSLSIRHPDNGLTFFFLKENRPFQDILTAVTYYPVTKTFIVRETDFGVVKAISTGNQLRFSSIDDRSPVDVGKVKINNQNFIFQKKKFVSWFVYDGSAFTFDPETTFNQFEHKRFFPNSRELKRILGPDSSNSQKFYFIAIRHESKTECFSLDISRGWNCL